MKAEQVYNQYAALFPLNGSKNNFPYQQCSISVMDNIADSNIRFDKDGMCNYYHEYQRAAKKLLLKGEAGNLRWKQTVEKIKRDKGGNKYDCLIGLSGGIDSSYVCLLAKEEGLNPLILHFDNTWNSEQSIRNVESLLDTLTFDYETHVVDNKTFEALQKAYIKSSVVDLDIITDHAIWILQYRIALKKNIKHVISGSNFSTEMVLPPDWYFNWKDQKNMLSIIKHTYPNSIDLSTFPTASFKEINQFAKITNLAIHSPIDWLDFDKGKVQSEIERKLNWKAFQGKHYESIWTRFYQCYILPVKYNIDKRKAHLSNLIYSNQLTKEEAIEILKEPSYSRELLKADMDLILSRLEWTHDEFEHIMKMPVRKHTDFAYQRTLRNQFKPIFNLARAIKNSCY
ncbi:MAG TPA: N-acetyl sugar amidotransferase [Bacteroidetes bacterium]|jgi:N-acetyl sugar amidotransferase|nr:N-acetyl sugar amidotransferase [Bacteroidota bacterium]